jgi:hypothetical protein
MYAASEESHKTLIPTTEKMSAQLEHHLQQKCAEYEEYLARVHTHINTHIKEETSTSIPQVMQKPSRFPPVQLDPHFKRSPNPYESSASLPDYNYRRSPTVSQTNHAAQPQAINVPTTVHVDSQFVQPPMDGLPPVNHDYAIK